MPAIRKYTERAWGAGAKERFAFIEIPGSPRKLSAGECLKPRMPTKSTCNDVLARDGRHCRFCGIPVVLPSIRQLIRQAYPNALLWGSTNISQHAAFQCMWLQFDHVLPSSRGGSSDLSNVVVTCAPCNFGRMDATLTEAQLADPLERPTPNLWVGYEDWDGLEKFASPLPILKFGAEHSPGG